MTKFVHPAEPTIELLIDQMLDKLRDLVPFVRSDSGRASGAPPVSRFDEGSKVAEDVATAHGR